MEARLDNICCVITKALDAIEEELFGAVEQHSMRLAVLGARIARQLGMDEDHVMSIAVSALLHDSALVEYYLSKQDPGQTEHTQLQNMRKHCEKGQMILDCIPLKHKPQGFTLYHHEYADGSGPFGKKAGEFPLEAEIISCIDDTDVKWNLQTLAVNDLALVKEDLERLRGNKFQATTIDVCLEILDEATLLSLRSDKVFDTVEASLPPMLISLDDPAIIMLANVNAEAIDYKSKFTRKHTDQIACRIYMMCDYYGYDEAQKGIMYLSAGLHDMGKAKTPSEILEKPGKLTDDEFEIIKKHVYYTYLWLKDVPGFDDICRWAAGHHEKLDGSGYPLGLGALDMDFNTRLLCCIDIYQAVSEARPYHDARSHADTMAIMYRMVDKGKIDGRITRDLDEVMAPWSMQDVPAPAITNCQPSLD